MKRLEYKSRYFKLLRSSLERDRVDSPFHWEKRESVGDQQDEQRERKEA